MWTLINHTPFAAERDWVRDKDGAEVWVVAVKGTFTINSEGSTTLSEKQEEVCSAPQYVGKPGKSSLLYDSDLLHTKTATDVILHGHAYAPLAEPTRQVIVTMKVANISKTLQVIGDRYFRGWPMGLSMTLPEKFVKMPLTYERAYGGEDKRSRKKIKHAWEPRNPVGTGFAIKHSHLIGQRAPNIVDLKANAWLWKRPRPLGFGPIAGNWSPRLGLAGTYDEKWERERLPLLPEDFDDRFYQCAPEDQQIKSFLSGGERVEFRNLTPTGYLCFNLPRVRLGFDTQFGEENIQHAANLHTVIFEPDVPRVIMVWHTTLPCHHKVLKLERTTVWQKM